MWFVMDLVCRLLLNIIAAVFFIALGVMAVLVVVVALTALMTGLQ